MNQKATFSTAKNSDTLLKLIENTYVLSNQLFLLSLFRLFLDWENMLSQIDSNEKKTDLIKQATDCLMFEYNVDETIKDAFFLEA